MGDGLNEEYERLKEEIEILKLQLRAREEELEEVRRELEEIHSSLSYRFGRWVSERWWGAKLKSFLRKIFGPKEVEEWG